MGEFGRMFDPPVRHAVTSRVCVQNDNKMRVMWRTRYGPKEQYAEWSERWMYVQENLERKMGREKNNRHSR